MKCMKEYWHNRGLGIRDIAILEAIDKTGGKATWTTLRKDPEPSTMSKRTLSKHLKGLIRLGFLDKKEERVNGKLTAFYVLQHLDYLKAMKRLEKKLAEKAKALYAATRKPGLSVEARQKRLIEGIHELLNYQTAWTLMTIKTSLSMPSEEKAGNHFLKMMDAITPHAAGSALWLCWENKDVATQVLDELLLKNKTKHDEKVV